LRERILGDDRDSLLNAQQLDHVQRVVLDGRWTEVLQAPIFFPHDDTLAFTEHLVGVALLSLPLRALTSDAVVIFNLVTVLALALNGLAAAFLGRVLSGSRAVGLCVGILYGMAPARLAHLVHLQHEMLFLPPLALGLLVLFARSGRPAPLLGAATCLAVQVGMVPTHAVYLPFFLAVPVASCWRALWGLGRRGWVVVAAGLAPLLGLAWLSVAPYVMISHRFGYARELDDAVNHAATLKALVTVDAHHDVAVHWMRQAPWGSLEETLWVGASLLVAALLGLSLGRYRAPVGPSHPAVLLLTTLVCLFMAFVPHGEVSGVPFPGRWLWDHLTFLHLIRGFSRFHLFQLVALAGLAAVGLAALRGRWPRAGAVAMGVLVAACLVELYPGPAKAAHLPRGGAAHPVYGDMRSRGGRGPFLELPYRLHGLAAHHNFATTWHHGKTASGYSGFIPPLPLALRWLVNTLPGEPALSVVRQLGVRQVVLFRPGPLAAPDDVFPTLLGAWRSGTLPPGLRFLVETEEAVAFTVDPLPEGPWTFSQLRPGGLELAGTHPAGGHPVTASVVALVDNPPRPNTTPRQRVEVEVVGEDGWSATHRVDLEAPPVLYAPRTPLALTFDGPKRPGRYTVRVLGQEGRLVVREKTPHSARHGGEPRARVEAHVPDRMKPRHTVVLEVKLANVGSTHWLAHAGATDHPGRWDVRLGWRWPEASGPLVEARWDLPRDVAPGEEVTLHVPLRAPEKAGTHEVRVDLLRQLIAWQEGEGGTPLRQTVEVAE
jgi:hypothetical protein